MLSGIAGISLATAPTASAGGYGCNGSLVGSAPVYGIENYTNTVVANIYIYWDGTYNCEVAVKKVFVGSTTRMELTLWSNHGKDIDPGYFSQYAGPVRVVGTNSCIWEELNMWDASGRIIAQSYTYAKHNCS
ncbi:hypothetical protein [Streptomyces stackebrandtii]|uniref:hypothetical protein n=1 Tax=Streptomyces stackebrandtii TaxID=3051177 RepID=UPI0028DCAA92|nr:hypothetical protein [Streptomyces sp. DSM 40976]